MGTPKKYRINIEKIVSGGAGLGRLEGKVVFVPYSLPGEEVEVSLEKGGRDFHRARLHRVLRPSPQRIEAPCPLFGLCGGCDLQHLSYDDQRQIKKEIFRETFRRIGGIDRGKGAPQDGNLPFFDSPPFAYRNRAQAHRGSQGAWGFKMAGSHQVVEVLHCPVVSPEINQFFARQEDSPGGDRLVLFGTDGDLFLEPHQEVELGLGGKKLLFSLDCFFQSNLVMLHTLLDNLFSDLSGNLALDLYAGVGTFGVFLAERFRQVLMVEGSSLAASYGRRNLPPGRGEVFSGSVESWISEKRRGETGKKWQKPDLIMVDPPRSGLSVPVREYILEEFPPNLLYLSCDPVTLARDTAQLLAGGYKLQDWGIYDFYPQTSHLECLCRFVPNSP